MKIEENVNTIILSQEFDAAKKVVFSMFKNPNIEKWWGPTMWPVKISEMDFNVGGSWHYNMVGSNNQEAWGLAMYEEIDEPNKIVLLDGFSNARGDMDESLPVGLMTITFEEKDKGKTLLTIRLEYKSEQDRKKVVEMGMLEGMKDTWNQLEHLLAKM
jgi:uncharacterized protein YndB with AHSA1/START domain